MSVLAVPLTTAATALVSGLYAFDDFDFTPNPDGPVLGWLNRFLSGVVSEWFSVVMITTVILFVASALLFGVFALRKMGPAKDFALKGVIVTVAVAVLLGAANHFLNWGFDIGGMLG